MGGVLLLGEPDAAADVLLDLLRVLLRGAAVRCVRMARPRGVGRRELQQPVAPASLDLTRDARVRGVQHVSLTLITLYKKHLRFILFVLKLNPIQILVAVLVPTQERKRFVFTLRK